MYLNLGFSVPNCFSYKKRKKIVLKHQEQEHAARTEILMSSVTRSRHLSLVLHFSKPEVSLAAEDENNATLKTTSQKQGIPNYLCLV